MNIDYKSLLNSLGIKCTKQRLLILTTLLELDHPSSVENIYDKIKPVDSTLNLSTIYRTLDLLVEKNLVIKSSFGEDKKFSYEINHMEHKHYLVCISCRKIVSIDDCPISTFEEVIQNSTGFEIIGHKLELFGYCPDCKHRVLL